MKIFIAPMVIGMLALAGASPVAAQSKSLTDKGTSVGVATPHDPAAERNSFTQRAQDELSVWQTKLHDFNAKLGTQATAAETKVSKDLDSAWNETRTAASHLQTAGEKDWDGAKSAFQTASHKLTVAWQKVRPNEK